jgi:hypothetical protein
MPSISLQTEITLDQLYQLIAQLKPKDKVSLAKKLRAEFALEQWLAISKKLPDVPEIGLDEILNEVKSVRKSSAPKA